LCIVLYFWKKKYIDICGFVLMKNYSIYNVLWLDFFLKYFLKNFKYVFIFFIWNYNIYGIFK